MIMICLIWASSQLRILELFSFKMQANTKLVSRLQTPCKIAAKAHFEMPIKTSFVWWGEVLKLPREVTKPSVLAREWEKWVGKWKISSPLRRIYGGAVGSSIDENWVSLNFPFSPLKPSKNILKYFISIQIFDWDTGT